MSRAKSLLLVRLVLAAAIILELQGCNNQSNVRVEKPIALATPAPVASATPVPKLPPPTKAEVEDAFRRVFGVDLTARFVEGQTFVVGDFNGDQSEDIGIIVRPAPGKLGDINSDFANWIIQDADKAFIPPPGDTVVVPPKQKPAKLASGETVLAVIHGFGPKGWRTADARQSYLIKHAAAPLMGTASSTDQKYIRDLKLNIETVIIKELRDNKKGYV
ncbi:MAG TPA: hypothetical protein VE133_06920, partial [Candidatus Sulfotelmatobacter sp.]|nr:hypothetical protein [Candidatus Sulfotelmatobacter sp.]